MRLWIQVAQLLLLQSQCNASHVNNQDIICHEHILTSLEISSLIDISLLDLYRRIH